MTLSLEVAGLLVAILLVAQWWACRKPEPEPEPMPEGWTYDEPEEPNNDAFMLGVRIAFWGSLFDD